MSDSSNPEGPRARVDITVEDLREFRRNWREKRRQWRGNAGVFTCGRSPAGRLFLAVALIFAGVALFLDNIGILRLRNIWEYSPLLMAAWGISVISGAQTLTRRYLGLCLMLFGVLGTLVNTGVLRGHTRDDSWLLALLLIAAGFFALLRTIEGGANPRVKFEAPKQPEDGSPLRSEQYFENVLNEHTVAGSIKRRVETQNFLGGKIECVFGSVELDLRYAQIVPNGKPVMVDIDCVFGSTKLRVPDAWMITVQATGVFGNIEDRTIPPRSANGMTAPTVVITGQSVFSSVEVEN